MCTVNKNKHYEIIYDAGSNLKGYPICLSGVERSISEGGNLGGDKRENEPEIGVWAKETSSNVWHRGAFMLISYCLSALAKGAGVV